MRPNLGDYSVVPTPMTPNPLLPYIATGKELASLRKRLATLARICRLPSLAPPPSLFSSVPTDDEPRDSNHAEAISRNTLRVLALTYAVTVLYENVLLGLLRRKSPRQFITDLRSTSAFRLALFLSSYSAIYRLSLQSLKSVIPQFLASPPPIARPVLTRSQSSFSEYRPRFRVNLLSLFSSKYLPPLLSAIIASPAMLLEQRGQRRVTFALYALARALQAGWEQTVISGILPKMIVDFSFGPLLFGIANGVLLHAFVYHPTTFPASLSRFILRFSSAYLPSRPTTYPSTLPFPERSQIVEGIASASRLRYPAFISSLLHPISSKAFAPDLALRGILPILEDTHPGHSNLVCAFLHPSDVSCWNVATGFVASEFKGAAKFFSALAVVSALVRYKKSLKSPESTLYRAALSTLTSSAFLSLSVGTAWSTICLFQKLLPGSFIPTKRFYLQGFLAGLWVALTNIGVSGGRATDLAMYSGRLALQTAWEVRVKSRKVKNIVNGEVVYFAASMGVLLSIYEVNPRCITSGFVRSALGTIAGPSASEKKGKAKEV